MNFTGKQRDGESGLDNFEARYDSSVLGRFMSPDTPRLSEKTDPQTWNLYSYVSNSPLARIDPTGHNWYKINGQWSWHDGNTWKDSNGNVHHSDYTMLLRIEKTGKRTKDGADIESIKLLGKGENDILASGTGYTGSTQYHYMTTPNGNYEINLNIRGGPSSERMTLVYGQPALARFPGIQALGDFKQDGVTWNAGGDWGDLRANLNNLQGEPTSFYLHGKADFQSIGRTFTHGCSTEPAEVVLKAIFRLNPSQVGEGDKIGRILVSVSGR